MQASAMFAAAYLSHKWLHVWNVMSGLYGIQLASDIVMALKTEQDLF